MAHPKVKANDTDFSSLVASRPKKVMETFTVEMSAFFPEMAEAARLLAEEKGEAWQGLLFTYRKLGINQIFALEEIITFVKRQRPDWSEKQCLEVAGLVACHLDPPARAGASAEENRAMLPALYCETFDISDDTELFLFLTEFAEKSGDFLKNLQAAVAGAKKNSNLPEEPEPSEPSTSA